MIAARRRRQHGVAAIEFALVFTVLFLVVYGILTFGAVLYTQQAVSRAAEDGARAIALLNAAPTTPELQSQIRDVVFDSLAGSLVVPAASNTDLSTRRAWVAAKVTVDVASPVASPNTNVLVNYFYSKNPLLPLMPLLASGPWVPDLLTGQASAALPPSSSSSSSSSS